ncbi:hypothetical protein BC834DRAFT_857625 [Gloeopeniophorella convolvens]|nr:hypothetical protein BC834DRAFT_857625 [Gloeopeniophorella convolvens]
MAILGLASRRAPMHACARAFSTTSRAQAHRAILYSENGQPHEVVRAHRIPTPGAPAPQTVNLRFVLSPINPADVNVIEGVYPAKPRPVSVPGVQGTAFVGGNEALAEVAGVGDGVRGLERGDWVIMRAPQVGTWRSAANVHESQVLKVPKLDGLSEVHAATMMVNPATAQCLLSQYTTLGKGDWVIQNGANSAVGQAVIQLARNAGLNSINLVRDRDDIDALKQELKDLGATHVLTYEELKDKKAIRAKVKEWTNGQDLRLGLNCVGGDSTTSMAGLLGSSAHLVTYGAMAKRPLTFPSSLFIFKNLTTHGFWLSRWFQENSGQQAQIFGDLAKAMASGQLKEPKHEIITIDESVSDEQASSTVREVFQGVASGAFKRKVILKIEGTDD